MIITERVQSMTGAYIFSLFGCPPGGMGGEVPQTNQDRGTPSPLANPGQYAFCVHPGGRSC